MRRNRFLLVMCFSFMTTLCFGNEVVSDTLKNPRDHPNDIIFVSVIDKWPEYIGGQKEMYKFISKNINETVATKKGRVNLRFVIEKDGSIGDVEILRSLCPTCDEEAKRVIKLMPKWIPGQIKNRNARCYYHMPIIFK
ncbi:MAG TPA: energy transducer TonB [Leadbetterella sp.]|nr:energy transducer TonB [Leadbetterella sp.]